MTLRSVYETGAALLQLCGITEALHFIRVKLLQRPVRIILFYHRIDTGYRLLEPDPTPSTIFEGHIRYIATRRIPVSLTNIMHESLSLRDDAYAVTFDDGYRDTYDPGVAILDRYGVPATYFICSSPLLARKATLLTVTARLLGAARAELISGDLPLRTHIAEFLDAPDRRIRENQAGKLFVALAQLSPGERGEAIDRLALAFGLDRFALLTETAVMTADQALRLQQAGHEIGAHTRSHRMVQLLDEGDLRNEIAGSISALRGAGFRIASFAYPFGERAHIPAGAPEVLRQAGVSFAVTAMHGVVDTSEDPFMIPRIGVGDESVALLMLKCEAVAWRSVIESLIRRARRGSGP